MDKIWLEVLTDDQIPSGKEEDKRHERRQSHSTYCKKEKQIKKLWRNFKLENQHMEEKREIYNAVYLNISFVISLMEHHYKTC